MLRDTNLWEYLQKKDHASGESRKVFDNRSTWNQWAFYLILIFFKADSSWNVKPENKPSCQHSYSSWKFRSALNQISRAKLGLDRRIFLCRRDPDEESSLFLCSLQFVFLKNLTFALIVNKARLRSLRVWSNYLPWRFKVLVLLCVGVLQIFHLNSELKIMKV